MHTAALLDLGSFEITVGIKRSIGVKTGMGEGATMAVGMIQGMAGGMTAKVPGRGYSPHSQTIIRRSLHQRYQLFVQI